MTERCSGGSALEFHRHLEEVNSGGEYEKTGEWEGHDVVKWAGEKESYEYWECYDCYCPLDQ